MAQQKNKTDADVATTSLNYDAMAPHWELPHALMGGTMAMVDAGQKYLPKEPKEQTKSYNNRLNRSVLFGGYSKTVNALSGKPFDKPVGLKAPKELEAMTSDVDLTGRNI